MKTSALLIAAAATSATAFAPVSTSNTNTKTTQLSMGYLEDISNESPPPPRQQPPVGGGNLPLGFGGAVKTTGFSDVDNAPAVRYAPRHAAQVRSGEAAKVATPAQARHFKGQVHTILSDDKAEHSLLTEYQGGAWNDLPSAAASGTADLPLGFGGCVKTTGFSDDPKSLEGRDEQGRITGPEFAKKNKKRDGGWLGSNWTEGEAAADDVYYDVGPSELDRFRVARDPNAY